MSNGQELDRSTIERIFERAVSSKTIEASGEPPRVLVDLYAIWKEKRRLDGLNITLLGDLKSGREAQALARLLGNFSVRLSFVSPAALSMPYELSDSLRAAGLDVEETNDLPASMSRADVLYLSPLDPAAVDPKVYARYKDYYSISPALLDQAPRDLLVLGDWPGADDLLAPVRSRLAAYSRELAAATSL